MKRFRFPLRPLSVLRSHRESRAREVFAAAVHRYVQAEEFLRATRARVAALEAALFAGRARAFNPAEETHNLNGYRLEAAAEVQAERDVIGARDQMAQRRQEYIEAHRQLEVVRRLEVKARSVHRAAWNREEQAEFDDFSARLSRSRPQPVSS